MTVWKQHLEKTGCNWQRAVWVKVVAARRRGSSGRRLLAAAYPHLYKTRPMSEEAKVRLRELGEKRKGMKGSKRVVRMYVERKARRKGA